MHCVIDTVKATVLAADLTALEPNHLNTSCLCLCQLACCVVQVRAVRLRRDRIVVALEHKVLSYNFADLKLLHQIETLGNSRGLLALSSTADSTVLACPGLHTGQVRLVLGMTCSHICAQQQLPMCCCHHHDVTDRSASSRFLLCVVLPDVFPDVFLGDSLQARLALVQQTEGLFICVPAQVRIELYDRKQTKFISAHNTPLVCLTLSMDGKRLATASDKGTLVRVWNTADGQLLQVSASVMGVFWFRLLLLPVDMAQCTKALNSRSGSQQVAPGSVQLTKRIHCKMQPAELCAVSLFIQHADLLDNQNFQGSLSSDDVHCSASCPVCCSGVAARHRTSTHPQHSFQQALRLAGSQQ